MLNAENIPENDFATQGNLENYFSHNADEVPYAPDNEIRCHIWMQKIIFWACVQIIIIWFYQIMNRVRTVVRVERHHSIIGLGLHIQPNIIG